jgi:hypothetical protein
LFSQKQGTSGAFDPIEETCAEIYTVIEQKSASDFGLGVAYVRSYGMAESSMGDTKKIYDLRGCSNLLLPICNLTSQFTSIKVKSTREKQAIQG